MKRSRSAPIGQSPSRLILIPTGFLLLLTAGCTTSDPQNVFRPASDLAAQISGLFSFIIWIAIGVFVVVQAALIWALIRFRASRSPERPAQIHGNTPIEIAWTIAPALILAIIAVPTILTIFRTYGPAPAEALEVRVIGHQWWWRVEYPAQNIVTANEVHVPVGQPVVFKLESADVIHSFWVPRLAGKRDLIPGRTNELWFTVNEPGVYEGQCAEFCGVQHANMRFLVIAEPPARFAAWVQEQQQGTAVAAGPGAGPSTGGAGESAPSAAAPPGALSGGRETGDGSIGDRAGAVVTQLQGTQLQGTQPQGTQPQGTQPQGTQPQGTQPQGTQPQGSR